MDELAGLKPRKLNDENLKFYKELFDRFDIDGNGYIEKRELIRSLNDIMISRVVKQLFKMYDRDHNNGLDFDEFINLIGN